MHETLSQICASCNFASDDIFLLLIKWSLNNNYLVKFFVGYFLTKAPFFSRENFVIYLQNKDCPDGVFIRSQGICKNSKSSLKMITLSLKAMLNLYFVFKHIILKYDGSLFRETFLGIKFFWTGVIKPFRNSFFLRIRFNFICGTAKAIFFFQTAKNVLMF